MSVSAIIVAAGSSRRMGFDKLAAQLVGKSVRERSIEAFEKCSEVDEIVVVTSAEISSDFQKLTRVVEGGAERHFSVWNGIQAIDPNAEYIAVHDGARPLVTPEAIAKCLAEAKKSGAATLAHPISDTLKRSDSDGHAVVESVSRDLLWAMETPQIFRADLLRAAYEKILEQGELVTDEVSAVQALGTEVLLVENPEPNLKITFPADLQLAEAILAARHDQTMSDR